MSLRKILGGMAGLAIVVASLFVWRHTRVAVPPADPPLVLNDASRLFPTTVQDVVSPTSEVDILHAVKKAAAEGRKIVTAGKRHSMGGHSLYPHALVLDMQGFNRITAFDAAHRIVTVQSGATWKDLQEYLNPLGFGIIAMQGPNIFTVGGSISVNAHGWDVRHGPVADTVVWCRVLLADGTITRCSGTEHSELFRLVLGGYGLFGVILDVGLRVTENARFRVEDRLMDYRDFPRHFDEQVLARPEAELAYGNLSIAPGSFLREVSAVAYLRAGGAPSPAVPLQEESHVLRDRFFFSLSRSYGWGKTLRWALQKQLGDEHVEADAMTRNNLMRSPMGRLAYYAPTDADILQEYFVPRARFAEFVDGLRDLMARHRVNLLSTTIRYIKANPDAWLNYAKRDAFAFVLYLNVPTSSKGQAEAGIWTRELIGLATRLGGTFYLPYLHYYGRDELTRAYPEAARFFALKKVYDPHEMFMNHWYARYALER